MLISSVSLNHQFSYIIKLKLFYFISYANCFRRDVHGINIDKILRKQCHLYHC